jgi:hypothetical protein
MVNQMPKLALASGLVPIISCKLNKCFKLFSSVISYLIFKNYRNVSKPLEFSSDPVTNNVAEIKAVIKAFEIVKNRGTSC